MMRVLNTWSIVAFFSLVLSCCWLQGQTIPTLFNTGVSGSGAALGDNAVDPHYSITAGPVTGNALVHNSAGGFPVPPWMPDQPFSSWISPTANTSAAGGTYTYRTTFDLTGLDPTTARITGRWATDDGNPATVVRLNGVNTGVVNTTGFGGLSPTFTIGTGFVPGVNTLDFDVVNGSAGPTGLRTDLHGEATTQGRVLINDLFNTGVGASRASLGDNAVDPHYTITAGPVTGNALVHNSSGGFPVPPWLGDSGLSAWISPTNDTSTAAGQYTYSTSFTIGADGDPLTAEINGLWAADDPNATLDQILLNGVAVVTGQSTGFGSFEAFSIGAGSPFMSGVNSLDFVINNGSTGPGGLRVDNLTGSYALAVPEPAAIAIWSLLALPPIGYALLRRKKK